MQKDLLSLLKNVAPEHGGTFGGKDDEQIFQDLLRGVSAMDMTFEEDGRPAIFFVMHPENELKLQALNSPERKRAFDEVIEAKRREWLRRESYRRLVD